jgi:hypothetical protein
MLKEVNHVVNNYPVSQRRACAFLEQPRSRQRLSLVVPSDFELVLRPGCVNWLVRIHGMSIGGCTPY